MPKELPAPQKDLAAANVEFIKLWRASRVSRAHLPI